MEQMQYALPFPRENLLVKGMLFFFPSFSFLLNIYEEGSMESESMRKINYLKEVKPLIKRNMLEMGILRPYLVIVTIWYLKI